MEFVEMICRLESFSFFQASADLGIRQRLIFPATDLFRRFRMAQIESGDVTLTVAKLAASFNSLAAALYAVAQIEPHPLVGLFLSAGPLFAVILWLQKDARRNGAGAVLDLGYFLLLAWPIIIPWYVEDVPYEC